MSRIINGHLPRTDRGPQHAGGGERPELPDVITSPDEGCFLNEERVRASDVGFFKS